jgi:hypothetical protein
MTLNQGSVALAFADQISLVEELEESIRDTIGRLRRLIAGLSPPTILGRLRHAGVGLARPAWAGPAEAD